MRISVFHYELVPKHSLSSRIAHNRALPRRGALLRVEADWGLGYSDLHPWTELGDLPLEEQLGLLGCGKKTRLTESSLRLAQVDGQARTRGLNAFDGLEIPESHFLVTHLEAFDFSEAHDARRAGFRRFKCKVGRNASIETGKLRELALELGPEVRFRLDFNASLSFLELNHWLTEAQPFLSQVEFLEDPLAWDPESWKKLSTDWGLSLAMDREGEGLSSEFQEEYADWVIIKPALAQGEWPKESLLSMAFTSYLDHPLGQMGAAYDAAKARFVSDRVGICGLLSQTAYERNAFSDELLTRGPFLLPPEGEGFGFGKLLESLKWEPLR